LKRTDIINTKFAQALTKKIFSTPPEQISTKENQTFIFLLSIALIHHFFVKRGAGTGHSLYGERPCLDLDSILTVAIDKREGTR
jgi:asparagine synthase (glutamine-hydrolysing)